jgi:dihydroxyacetone kinase
MSPTASAGQLDRLLRIVVDVSLTRRAAFDALDAAAGDGDFGSTLARGAAALARASAGAADGSEDAAARLREAAQTVTAAMGGSSGPLCGVALLRAADALDGDGELDAADAGRLADAAIGGIQEYGEAEVGDKTLLDALVPLARALADGASAADAAAAAREGADATAELEARRGRASYTGERSRGAVDPGAVAVAEIAQAAAGGGEPPAWDALAERAERLAGGEENDEEPAVAAGFVTSPADLVSESLDGLAREHPDLLRRLDGEAAVVGRAIADGEPRVGVLSGGGAGHEPLHAGFVGAGMLDAACPGAVFTSPAPGGILAATRAIDRGRGVLHVVKRYTGDVLNFRLAAELAAADGIEVATVIVDDDVAIPADAPTGRRGTGVTVVAEKVAGAAAARGDDLDAVAAVARRAVERGRSYGVALHDDGEMELGVGIHGEPGRSRVPIAPSADVARQLVDAVLEELDPDPQAPLLVLLSGLGGTPGVELHALFAHVAAALDGRGRTIARSLVGDLITSLHQAGAVLSIVVLDDELTELWDAPVRTPALTR